MYCGVYLRYSSPFIYLFIYFRNIVATHRSFEKGLRRRESSLTGHGTNLEQKLQGRYRGHEMQGGEDLSIEELASNLSTYKDQLREIKKILADDPGNSEYIDMEKELEEVYSFMMTDGLPSSCLKSPDFRCSCCYSKFGVIALTEELLTTAKPTDFHRLDSVASPNTHFDGTSHSKSSSEHSQPYGSFPVGTKVQAVWSEDGEWYDATIESITPNGYFVSYEVWGNTEEFLLKEFELLLENACMLAMLASGACWYEQRCTGCLWAKVDFANVRPVEEVNALLEAEREAEATRQAIKRKIAQAAITDFQARTLPAKLRIDPNDPDDVKAAKRKKIHSFKSKVRSEQLEVAQNKRQNAWQQFQSAKGKTKKIGFFSGRKRESIFKSPDDPNGKVGVIGSGKGLTEFQKREKHLHLKGGTVDTEE
ncbi:hypothetical protein ZIOFF_034311 [Zingiber officinale]|uniref:Survival of motor neuron-related-splicing factor 30 n=1 Tax=Zingiber officinale TaxID=94328 RepID=A0A8J5H3K1_ZINOF|nr:hypothetical protein ZIOFF_034311 [Zingiber officinale]